MQPKLRSTLRSTAFGASWAPILPDVAPPSLSPGRRGKRGGVSTVSLSHRLTCHLCRRRPMQPPSQSLRGLRPLKSKERLPATSNSKGKQTNRLGKSLEFKTFPGPRWQCQVRGNCFSLRDPRQERPRSRVTRSQKGQLPAPSRRGFPRAKVGNKEIHQRRKEVLERSLLSPGAVCHSHDSRTHL